MWRRTEPGTAPPRQRLRALKTLVEAGIKAGVGMAPILPGLSDRPEQLAEVVKAARDAGATHVWCNVLFLRPGTREHFLARARADWPELLPTYEQLYARAAYLRGPRRPGSGSASPSCGASSASRDRRLVKLAPAPEPEQLALAV